MNTIVSTDNTAVGVRKVDAARGATSFEVSQQWWSRPDDERFVHLADLIAAVRERNANSITRIMPARELRFSGNPQRMEAFQVEHSDLDAPVVPSSWAFGQLCQRAEAPAKYLRTLPGFLAGRNLAWGMATAKDGLQGASLYVRDVGRGPLSTLAAATSETYERISDLVVAESVERLVERDPLWKVPGEIDWTTGMYDPDRQVTKANTTLYASDRDLFIFLVDDKHPIKVGTLPDGSPDYICRGIILSNSEVGSASLKFRTFYFRAVCQNRCIWGTEQWREVSIRHVGQAGNRFIRDVQSPMMMLRRESDAEVVALIDAAKKPAEELANDKGRVSFLRKRGLTETQAKQALQACTEEEGEEAFSPWLVAQGVTAMARERVGFQDERVTLEAIAGKIITDGARKGR